jgi:nucleotide-binding universal stress UspA family protein
MKIQKILAGIDLEEGSERVLAYASLFADVFGASLGLLYVIDYLVTPPAYLTQYIEKEKRGATEKLASLRARVTGAGCLTDSEVVVGRLRESFEAIVKREGVDVLVLGFMSHPLRRSSSEKLIKALQTPVLVVKGRKTDGANIGSVKIRKILCPVDFSDASGKALNAAMELADAFSAKLNVLYVSPDYLIRKMRSADEGGKAAKALVERAENKFEEFLEGFSIKETGRVEVGEPAGEIVLFAGREDVDLIVMGARGFGFIQGMLVGSVTDAVLKSSPCPVFVIH